MHFSLLLGRSGRASSHGCIGRLADGDLFRVLLVVLVLLELTALARRVSFKGEVENDGNGRSFGVTVHFK